MYTTGTGASNTAALCASGENSPGNLTATTEIWNGSSWTESGDINSNAQGRATAGTVTGALLFGGEAPSVLAHTEDWNGATWVEVADLSTGRKYIHGTGASNTAALGMGGNTAAPAFTTSTEEWSGSSVTTKVLTD